MFNIPIYLEHDQKFVRPVDMDKKMKKLAKDFKLTAWSLSADRSRFWGMPAPKLQMLRFSGTTTKRAVDEPAIAGAVSKIFIA